MSESFYEWRKSGVFGVGTSGRGKESVRRQYLTWATRYRECWVLRKELTGVDGVTGVLTQGDVNRKL